MDALVFLGILVGIVLIAVIFIETNEYRKYVVEARNLNALGEAMKISFEQIGSQMNKFSAIQSALMLDAEEKDSRLRVLELVQSAHTEALTVKLLTDVPDFGQQYTKSSPPFKAKDVTGI